MMASNRISPATAGGRALNHILQWSVVLDHIEIGRGKAIDMMPEILRDRQGLQENLGEQDR